MATASARACANIALVKYWGKRPGVLNLPAAGSISLTLGALVTETTVTFDSKTGHLFAMSQERGPAPPPPPGGGRGGQGAAVPGSFTILMIGK